MTKAFKVSYKCNNCGLEFAEEYEKGDEIEDKWDGPYLNSHNCTHDIGCEACRGIFCPNCETRNVNIEERKPI